MDGSKFEVIGKTDTTFDRGVIFNETKSNAYQVKVLLGNILIIPFYFLQKLLTNIKYDIMLIANVLQILSRMDKITCDYSKIAERGLAF